MVVQLEITDSNGNEYLFEVVRASANADSRSVGIKITNEFATENSNQMLRWKYQLHPFDFGLAGGRDILPRSYIDANADVSNGQYIAPPPKIYTLSMPLGNGCTRIVEYNGEIFFLCGQYVYRCNSSYAVTLDRDLGAGVTGTDMVVFNNKLVVACGSSGYMQERDASGAWTTSTDTSADKLAVVNERLWRSYGNQLWSCSTGPLVAANYIQSNNVGDTTYKVNALVEYGGVVWPIKENGAYQADVAEVFKNQTPQMAQWPNAHNGRGTFVAKGSLFVPSINGLIEVNRGISRFVGPERANRPVSNMLTYGGIEWQGYLLLACMDNSGKGAYTVKMMPDETGMSGRQWIYHQLCYLNSGTAVPASITVSTIPTNPTVFVGMTSGTTVYYFTLGRGGGKDINDPNYTYQNTWYLETGSFQPVDDRSVVSIFHGMDIVSSLGSNDGLAVRVTNDLGDSVVLQTDHEYIGETIVRNTYPMARTRLYAPPGFTGRQFSVMIFGDSATSNAGPVHPKVYEAWAFGYLRPEVIEQYEIAIQAADFSRTGGIMTGIGFKDTIELFLKWKEEAEVLTLESPFLMHNKPVRCIVTNIQVLSASETYMPYGVRESGVLMVEFARLSYARA